MGYSSQKRNILLLLGALETVMRRNGAKVTAGKAVDAAMDIYMAEEVNKKRV